MPVYIRLQRIFWRKCLTVFKPVQLTCLIYLEETTEDYVRESQTFSIYKGLKSYALKCN